jgi:hypothetical protein
VGAKSLCLTPFGIESHVAPKPAGSTSQPQGDPATNRTANEYYKVSPYEQFKTRFQYLPLSMIPGGRVQHSAQCALLPSAVCMHTTASSCVDMAIKWMP